MTRQRKILLVASVVGLLGTAAALAQSGAPSVKGLKGSDPATGQDWYYAKIETDGGKAILTRCRFLDGSKAHCEGRAL